MIEHVWFDKDIPDSEFNVKEGVATIIHRTTQGYGVVDLSAEDIIYIAKQLGMTKERFA